MTAERARPANVGAHPGGRLRRVRHRAAPAVIVERHEDAVQVRGNLGHRPGPQPMQDDHRDVRTKIPHVGVNLDKVLRPRISGQQTGLKSPRPDFRGDADRNGPGVDG